GNFDMIERRLDSAARGRFEEDCSRATARYPTVFDDHVQRAFWLDVQRDAGRVLEDAVFQDQGPTALEKDMGGENRTLEGDVAESRCRIQSFKGHIGHMPLRTVDIDRNIGLVKSRTDFVRCGAIEAHDLNRQSRLKGRGDQRTRLRSRAGGAASGG